MKDLLTAATNKKGTDKTAYDDDTKDAGPFGVARLAMEAAKKTMDEKIAAHTAQSEEKARQDAFVLQVTKAKEDATAALGTLDTEVGVSNTGIGLKKALTDATAATGTAEGEKTTAKENLDKAVNAGKAHHDSSDYATNVTEALAELKKKREAANA